MGIRFGQKMRQTRLAKGLGLRETARALGVSPTYLARIESSEADPPAERVLRSLARVLKVDLVDVLVSAKRVPARVEKYLLARPKELRRLLKVSRVSARSGRGPRA